MSLFEIPALVLIIAFVVSLSPSRRPSHYLFAFLIALACGSAATVFSLIVWGITQ